MVANFSLYWGLSIMLYEATLVSNNSPFDPMLRGNPSGVNARWEREKCRLGPIHLDRLPTELQKPRPPLVTGAAVFLRGHRLFLNRGGDVPADLEHNPDKNPAIVPLDMSDEDQRALEFFLLFLTDGNVQHDRAPFDHPSLTPVNGYDEHRVEQFVRVMSVGVNGRDCPPSGFPSDD